MKKKEISFGLALLPIGLLIIMLTINAFVFDDALGGPNQIALLMAAFIGIIIAWAKGYSWEHVNRKIISTIGSAMPSMLILLIIGSLAGTWLISGVVPSMVYYGLSIISPKFFLVTAVIVSAIISVVTGSSWSTIATIGIALLGIGNTLGFDPALTAGAIISGAYFGDKMSPLSDTTNLAPAMAGADLFTHIRYMVYTTVPSMILTLLAFFFIGLFYKTGATTVEVSDVQAAIQEVFYISPVMLLVPVILFVIIAKKVPALPALFIGTLLGVVFALIFQIDTLEMLGDAASLGRTKALFMVIMQSMFGEISITTSLPSVNDLLNTSGMAGMLNTIWLILTAMIFGGVMEAAGILERLIRPIVQRANSDVSLVSSTVLTCMFFNGTASDQYIALVVPGRMFKGAYDKRGLKPEVLSRTLEDSGTITSVLVPWNTCGATQARVLGVATMDYLPYCFFNILSPLMTIAVTALNYKIRRQK